MSQNPASASPAPPRAKHQHSKSVNRQPPRAQNGRQGQRRNKGNRANNNGNSQQNEAIVSPNKSPQHSDRASQSSEEARIHKGPQTAKKPVQAQSAANCVSSPKNISTASTAGSQSPSNSSTTPAKEQAYAGPTFHASPAPSTIPLPKFLSKSVPADSRAGPPTPPPEESSDSAGSPSPTLPSPSRAPIPVPPRIEESPLDMLFKADRVEKARNTTISPPTTVSPPNSFSAQGKPQHSKQDSFNSLNAVFPIELDGESRTSRASPPSASLAAHRSVTAPSRVPQLDNFAKPPDGPDAVQDLFNRLALSQKKTNASTPPANLERVPSDPSSRHQTPSPFYDGKLSTRSASGPTTPAPTSKDPSEFYYGNRDLSPLFKAARTDPVKRNNSGLRTEITADSPTISQGSFPRVQKEINKYPNALSRGYSNDPCGGSVGQRSSPNAPQSFQTRDAPNQFTARNPNRRSCQSHPDNPSQAMTNGPGNGNLTQNATFQTKPRTSMAFIPSSVKAKRHSGASPTPPVMKASTPDTNQTDHITMEQDLKRMLNLDGTGNATGVR